MPRAKISLDVTFQFGDGTETAETVDVTVDICGSNRECLSAAVQSANAALDDLERRQAELVSAATVQVQAEDSTSEDPAPTDPGPECKPPLGLRTSWTQARL